MVYRIRYRETNSQADDEMTVEAHSPNEAMVKFQHINSDRSGVHRGNPRVTSVQPDMDLSESNW